jgi:flagellar biosynthesis/type III secretory pathway protein FliH
MFDLLSDEQHRDFAVIGYLFAARTFELLKQESNLAWLEERGRHMDDFLCELPAYRWIIERGHEEGKAQGLAQVRQAVVDFVQEDFPELVQLAKEVVATIDNPAHLVRLTAKLGGAQNTEQARKVLSALV